MKEEANLKIVELTDEEAEKAAGGIEFTKHIHPLADNDDLTRRDDNPDTTKPVTFASH